MRIKEALMFFVSTSIYVRVGRVSMGLPLNLKKTSRTGDIHQV